ncbi:MAG: preprotein translocase subunit SecG [Azospira oryzae]|jgi:preprotein translocase subunit SecG|nr:MAG: preprotein translocase subunit SecG [Azospira oryzae]
MLYSLFIGLAIFCAVLLVLVVLAQNSKGGGLSNQFGGSGASNLIGVKKTGDLLERLTWGFAIAIMVLSLATNLSTPNTGRTTDDILERAKETQTAPAAITPAPAATDTAK